MSTGYTTSDSSYSVVNSLLDTIPNTPDTTLNLQLFSSEIKEEIKALRKEQKEFQVVVLKALSALSMPILGMEGNPDSKTEDDIIE